MDWLCTSKPVRLISRQIAYQKGEGCDGEAPYGSEVFDSPAAKKKLLAEIKGGPPLLAANRHKVGEEKNPKVWRKRIWLRKLGKMTP